MSPKPRRKNISREIRDIRFPTSHVPRKSSAAESPVRKVRPLTSASAPVQTPTLPPGPSLKRPITVFICIVLIALITGGALWYRDRIAQAFRLREALVQALHIQAPLDIPGVGSTSPSSLGGWFTLMKSTLASLGSIQGTSWQALGAISQAQGVLQDLPVMLLQKNGPGLIADLTSLRDTLEAINDALQGIDEISGDGSGLSDLSGYLAYQPDIERARDVVDALIALLRAPGQHHILVLFGNSAELRPGGGFLGSFADVSFGSSTINGITVHDINEIDRGFAANIVPPKPLQGIVSRWRAADANWFFDYPDSARKTIEFMSQSSFYASSTASTTLDGAILISPQIIKDLLTVTGPLTLAGGTTTVTAQTVMPMIQREVQAGQANGAAAPKEILAELMSSLEVKLQALDSGQLDQLLAAARDWIKNKDIEIFMTNPQLAKVLAYYQADGGLYVLPQDFPGDYFAAVNANIGGGKSDAFISDIIDIESDLRADGVINDRVDITRANSAAVSDDWWYQVTNQDYLQIFTPPDVTLEAARGGRARSITPRIGYAQGFVADPDVAAMESTFTPISGIPSVSQFRESGKNVFATWLTTPAGQNNIAHFEYQRALGKSFRDGDLYTFVFERQSGANQALDVTLNAPPGFVWKTSGFAKYEYINPAAPGRVMLTLTLQEIQG